jgi:pseudaminic acid synthase
MKIKIGKRTVGPGSPAFVIAEMSANHNQDFDVALNTIKAMKDAGADAVKLQTYTPDTMTIDAKTKYFKIRQKTLWDGQTLYGLYKTAYTPWEWHEKLQKVAHRAGLEFFSSPFDATSANFLKSLRVPAYKIASFEINDIPLVTHVAKFGKPMIMSTGVAREADIWEAIKACQSVGNDQIVLLQCVSAYPARPEDMNLRTMNDMEKRFGVLAGLSDHTLGVAIPVAAVALGARVIEKHFILDKKVGGPDCAFSLDPREFKEMVVSVRSAEAAIGKVSYELSEASERNRAFARSIFIVEDFKKGDALTEKNIRSIRPGFGLHPRYLPGLIGKRAIAAGRRGMPFSFAYISTADRKSLRKPDR